MIRFVLAAVLGLMVSVSGLAQTRLIVLGTQGGPRPSPQRSAPASAVVVKDRVYLVDAGNGVARQLAAAGIDIRRIDRIFITHNHDDHNADWGTLMGLRWSLGRSTDVDVFGPEGTQDMLAGFLRYFAPNVRIRQADSKTAKPPQDLFHAHDINASGPVFKDDLVVVSAIENCHYHDDASAQPRDPRDKSFAFRFQTPDQIIVFSGDTGRCPQLTEFAHHADVLVQEVIDLPAMERFFRKTYSSRVAEDWIRHMAQDHMVPEDVGRLARDAGVKKVVLSHLVPGGDGPDAVYSEGVKRYYSGPVVVGRDLMSF